MITIREALSQYNKTYWRSAFALQSGVPEIEGECAPCSNNKGWMTLQRDIYTKRFLQQVAANPNGIYLDLGCAYGLNTIPSLAVGGNVIAIDSCQAHIDTLRRLAIGEGLLENLTTQICEFPAQDIDVSPGSVDAILASRVMHFMDGASIKAALEKFALILKPGGIVYLVADSPYKSTLKEFIPIFEANRAKGDEWPGWADMKTYEPEVAQNGKIPEFMHLLCPHVLSREILNQGQFILIESNYFDRGSGDGFPSFLMLKDEGGIGREGTVAIFQKK